MLLCIQIIPLSKSGHFCTSGCVTYNHFVFWTMQKGLNASVKSHLDTLKNDFHFFKSLSLYHPFISPACLICSYVSSCLIYSYILKYNYNSKYIKKKKPLQNRIIYFGELPWIGPWCLLNDVYSVVHIGNLTDGPAVLCLYTNSSTSSTAMSDSTLKV